MSDENEPLGILELDGNLADAEKPPILAKGKYKGEVQSVEVKTSGTGNNYYAIGIKVPPSEIPADMQDAFEDGATMYWNRQLVPTAKDARAKFNLRKMVENFGLSTQTTTIDPNEWIGCSVGLVVTHERYQGEDRANVQSLYTIDEGRSVPTGKGKAAEPAKATGARRR